MFTLLFTSCLPCCCLLLLFVVVFSDTFPDPVNISEVLELPVGDIGEIIVSGWHVNTYQVNDFRTLHPVGHLDL